MPVEVAVWLCFAFGGIGFWIGWLSARVYSLTKPEDKP